MTDDEKFMMRAMELARQGLGHTSPNPVVGAVVVRDGEIIGEGYHRRAGEAHAEVEALRGVEARGATLYVTLEPCSTHGRTPPCTDAVVNAGVLRVVIGTMDPNPAHGGRGMEILKARGVEVCAGVLEVECRRLNLPFNKWMTTGMPWVIAKAGMTLDGRLNRGPGKGRWITNETSRAHAHQVRAQVDAILVGAGTVRDDRPLLTVRGVPGAKQPQRVVLSRSGEFPRDIPLFQMGEPPLVLQTETLSEAMAQLGKTGIQSVLIEGGAEVLGAAFDEKIVDEVYFYTAPLLSGGPVPAVGGKGAATHDVAMQFTWMEYRVLDGDVLAHGYAV